MLDAAQVWAQSLPEVRKGVTGVGIWAALNSAKPVAFEDGTLVLGLAPKDGELAGHLRMPQTKRLIEQVVSRTMGTPTAVRLIEGCEPSDWERAKRRDIEAKRLEEQHQQRLLTESAAKVGWETVYEQLGRRYAAVPNKSLPQNRARFYAEALDLLAEARRHHAERDEPTERNFARCIERVAQYAEIPSTIVAIDVLKRTSEG